MREDLSAETLDVVYDGSKMTLGALFSIFQIASEHHNKSIHTGEQSVKHFYESAQKNEILDEIDPEDWRGIRSMMKNRYHLDFAYEKDAEKGTYTLHFRGKDLATIELAAIIIWSHNISPPVIFAPVDRSKPLPILLPVLIM